MPEPRKYNLKFPGMPQKQYRENLEHLMKAEAELAKLAAARRRADRVR